MLDALSIAVRDTRSIYHLTLGELINTLKSLEKSMPVVFDDDHNIGTTDSYRGYYVDLAISKGESLMECATFLKHLENEVLNKEFTGYKGGEFMMGLDTPLWRAEYGVCGEAIMDAVVESRGLVLKLKTID